MGEPVPTELRDWATRELKGYGPNDELPEYRKIVAPLHLDAMNMRWIMKGQQVSPTELPDFARDKINNDLNLRMGIAEIEKLARQTGPDDDVVKLQPSTILGDHNSITASAASAIRASVVRLPSGSSNVCSASCPELLRNRASQAGS